MSARERRDKPARVILSERALADIREIERYSIVRWGRRTAERYIDDIAAALDRLGENPTLLRSDAGISPGLYFYRVRKHVLVCVIREPRVYLLTVVHTSIDLPARLVELQPQLAAEVELLHARLP